MAAAVVQLQVATGAGPTLASGESGFKYNREDTLSGTTPIPIPTATGTNYSWVKTLALVVTTSGTTAISNRRIQLSTTESTGLGIFFKASATYAQATAEIASAGTNGPATPATWTRATTSLQVYDSGSTAASGATGKNGQYCLTCLGVDSTFAGGAGNAVQLGGSTMDVRLVYDEAHSVDIMSRDAVECARDPLATSTRRGHHCRRRGRAEAF